MPLLVDEAVSLLLEEVEGSPPMPLLVEEVLVLLEEEDASPPMELLLELLLAPPAPPSAAGGVPKRLVSTEQA